MILQKYYIIIMINNSIGWKIQLIKINILKIRRNLWVCGREIVMCSYKSYVSISLAIETKYNTIGKFLENQKV